MSAHRYVLKISASVCSAAIAAAVAVPALAADFPAGTYSGPQFTLSFDGNGHFHGSLKGVVKVEGDYTVSGDQLQFTDKSGEWACTRPGEQTGTYRWKSEGDTLTFGKVNDACRDRVGSLTPQPWKKQG